MRFGRNRSGSVGASLSPAFQEKAMKKKLFTRNFTLLLLGQASSLVGNYTLRFALSMLVLE